MNYNVTLTERELLIIGASVIDRALNFESNDPRVIEYLNLSSRLSRMLASEVKEEENE